AAAAPAGGLAPRWQGRTLAEARRAVTAEFLRGYLAEVLTATGGRMGEAAALAGINVRTLYDLMRQQGLRKEDFRAADRRAARPPV
ncbi:MAG: sigma-54-dependent Fis family transcriptional regulator, partial [Krumholzibacteria bacterium]|nr:sigma-54-dependent Fis family transcriptional regulator [Candidatus Krumholzibacteria bacterium]